MISMNKGKFPCVTCRIWKCRFPESSKEYPKGCPAESYNDLRKETIKKNLTDSKIRRINTATEVVLSKGAGIGGQEIRWMPRIREIIEFAKYLGYKKLGVAFCVGLQEEARILTDILEKAGFDTVAIGCMSGGFSRNKFAKKVNIERSKFLGPTICNPLMQAEVLNNEGTELNIMVGLCVGHDILFIKNSRADVTPLIVKDKVLAHNPILALYTSHSYYRSKIFE